MAVEMTDLGLEDKQQAVDILVRAFHDDPVMNWVCARPGFLDIAFDMIMPVFMPHGLTYIAGQGEGIASWLGPGDKLAWPFKLGNFALMARFAGFGALYRLALSGLKLEKYHPKAPHYYLFAIGALPERQGQGVGTALMSHLLRRCDAEKMPAYLENSREANLAFYRGHGFEVMRKVQFGKMAPPIWLMWREPR